MATSSRSGNRAVTVESGPFLKDARDLAELVVGVRNAKPVFLQDVATVRDGPRQVAGVVSEQVDDLVQTAATTSGSSVWVADRRGSRAPVADRRETRPLVAADELRVVVAPLLAWCQSHGRPTSLDATGEEVLRALPLEAIRVGVRNTLLLSAQPGRPDRPVRNPLGLLVDAARRYHTGDTGFFTTVTPTPGVTGTDAVTDEAAFEVVRRYGERMASIEQPDDVDTFEAFLRDEQRRGVGGWTIDKIDAAVAAYAAVLTERATASSASPRAAASSPHDTAPHGN